MSIISKRAEFLRSVIDERGDAFIGVEIHFDGHKYFEEGHVLEVTKDDEIIVDIRKSPIRKALKDERGVSLPGVLLLKTRVFNEDDGFYIEGCNIFITD